MPTRGASRTSNVRVPATGRRAGDRSRSCRPKSATSSRPGVIGGTRRRRRVWSATVAMPRAVDRLFVDLVHQSRGHQRRVQVRRRKPNCWCAGVNPTPSAGVVPRQPEDRIEVQHRLTSFDVTSVTAVAAVELHADERDLRFGLRATKRQADRERVAELARSTRRATGSTGLLEDRDVEIGAVERRPVLKSSAWDAHGGGQPPIAGLVRRGHRRRDRDEARRRERLVFALENDQRLGRQVVAQVRAARHRQARVIDPRQVRRVVVDRLAVRAADAGVADHRGAFAERQVVGVRDVRARNACARDDDKEAELLHRVVISPAEAFSRR